MTEETTTIRIKRTTKERLDNARWLPITRDCFVQALLHLWDNASDESRLAAMRLELSTAQHRRQAQAQEA